MDSLAHQSCLGRLLRNKRYPRQARVAVPTSCGTAVIAGYDNFLHLLYEKFKCCCDKYKFVQYLLGGPFVESGEYVITRGGDFELAISLQDQSVRNNNHIRQIKPMNSACVIQLFSIGHVLRYSINNLLDSIVLSNISSSSVDCSGLLTESVQGTFLEP